MSVRYKICQKLLVSLMSKIKAYTVGQKIKRLGGVAQVTSVNPDGTATANWVKPPKQPLNGKIQKAGGFAATLPALNNTLNEKYVNTLTGEVFNDANEGTISYETYANYETKTSEPSQSFFTSPAEKLGLPNELSPEASRIRLHNILITDHPFIQDPDDIPGGCKTCWESISKMPVE
jgi:hypothetical protein